MLQKEALVKVVDNTGAKTAKIMGFVARGSQPRSASIGDVVVVAIKSATPKGLVQKGEVHRAVIVRTKKESPRKDGTYVRSEDNAIALIDKEGVPLGKRIFGPVFAELRDKGYKQLTTMAEEIV